MKRILITTPRLTLIASAMMYMLASAQSPSLLTQRPAGPGTGQNTGTNSGPRVVTPRAPTNPFQPLRYPWKKNITATIFWIGEKPTPKNPTPNHASSWDTKWMKNYGGYDDPDPAARIQYRPKAFTPRLNPFYVALPYNDVINHRMTKPEASQVIPWWNRRADLRAGKTSCKGRWLQIVYGRRVCYAQWEDCGPFVTDDYEYVFGNKPPKNKSNKNAGIDISPAVRDYLGVKSGQKVHWRFIDFNRVPRGPWATYGKNNPFLHRHLDPDYQARRAYMKYLKRLRDEAYKKRNNRR